MNVPEPISTVMSSPVPPSNGVAVDAAVKSTTTRSPVSALPRPRPWARRAVLLGHALERFRDLGVR
jgi:hypothetical protein